MASVSSVSNSYSSIYGNKNVITGLASGLDTEAMIEKSVSGYQLKIQQLQQQQTKLEWKQDAYRSITDKLIALSRNYTSYTSSTNLYSPSFFNQYTITPTGENAGAISATGKSSSDVAINSVTQLATAAKYTVNAADLGLAGSLTGSGKVDLSEMASGYGISVTVDGVTKNYSLMDTNGLGLKAGATRDDLVNALNKAVEKDFGKDKLAFKLDGGKLAVDEGKSSALSKDNSLVKVSSNLEGVGLGEGLSNYLDTSSSTLGELLKTGWGLPDKDGNYTAKRSLTINGVKVGEFGYDTSLSDVINAINKSDAGVTASYSALTGEFSFTAKETGSAGKIEFGDGLAKDLFGKMYADNYSEGKDAILNVTINGTDKTLVRSSNSVDIDGMTVTLKDTFDSSEGGPVKFEAKTDTESIISGIKAFVNDYNEIVRQIHEAYATRPAEKNSSTHTKYEPLTDDDKAGMSESAIEKYEEKAKQGLLFGDYDLSSLYSKLTSMVSSALYSKDFRDLGIETSFDSTSKVTTLKIDEKKLTAALESNPDKVASFFTQTSADGTNIGLMDKMKETLDAYASTSIATPGILVSKAGTTLSSNSLQNNTVQKQIDSIADKISTWQTKMSDKIDYYTKQFTALETLIAKLNEQSSSLASLMGGY